MDNIETLPEDGPTGFEFAVPDWAVRTITPEEKLRREQKALEEAQAQLAADTAELEARMIKAAVDAECKAALAPLEEQLQRLEAMLQPLAR